MTIEEFEAEVRCHKIFHAQLLTGEKVWIVKTLALNGAYYELVSIKSYRQIQNMSKEELSIELHEFLLHRCFGPAC